MKRIFSFLIALLLVASTSGATQLANITGAEWPTSGTATALTTGLNTVEAGKWTHVGASSSDLPPNSSATGYIETADDAGGQIRIDATTVPFADKETDHWVRLWVRPVRTATSLAANNTSSNFMTFYSSGQKITSIWYLTNIYDLESISITSVEYLSTGPPTESSRGGDFSTGGAGLAFGEWTEIVVHLKWHETDGVFELYNNGVLFVRGSSMATTEIAIADARSRFTVLFPAINGIKWQIAGPLESWSGTDIVIRPKYEMVKDSSWLTKFWDCSFQSLPQGSFWDTSESTGTSTSTLYATSGTNNFKSRFVGSGSEGQTIVAQSYDNIGVLPYNEKGWSTITWDMLYLPSGATGSFQLKDTSGDALIALSVTGGNLMQGATTLAPWDSTKRYALSVHLSNSGGATFTLHNLTDSLDVQTIWSGQLDDWTPQEVGKVRNAITIGTANVELDGVSVFRWALWAGLDSLTQGGVYAVTPALVTINYITEWMPYVKARSSIPNVAYRGKQLGYNYQPVSQILGRSGQTRTNFTTNALAHMTYSHGICFLSCDGGSINDIALINTSDPTTKVNEMAANVKTMIETLYAGDNKVWMSTMIDRVQGTTFSTEERQGILMFNNKIRALARRGPGTVILSDVATAIGDPTAMFNVGDDIHFNDYGTNLYVQYLLSAAKNYRYSGGSGGFSNFGFGLGF